MSETAQQALPKAKKSVALSGVAAGNTALCTVGRTGNDLAYRGYDIKDLAEQGTFEEIAYLLVYGFLPTADELRRYKVKLARLRGLPEPVKSALELIPASAHPMDVMRTGCSVLGTVLPEKDDHNLTGARDIADRLMASFGSMLLYWHHWTHNGRASRPRPRTTRSPRISCTCCTARSRARCTSARWTSR
jgi:2-methylcitrate synthase